MARRRWPLATAWTGSLVGIAPWLLPLSSLAACEPPQGTDAKAACGSTATLRFGAAPLRLTIGEAAQALRQAPGLAKTPLALAAFSTLQAGATPAGATPASRCCFGTLLAPCPAGLQGTLADSLCLLPAALDGAVLAADVPWDSVVGIAGGKGKDLIAFGGTLDVAASAHVDSSTKAITLTGGESTTADTLVEARAVGIEAGGGKDGVSHTGTMAVSASATLDSFSAELNLIDRSHGRSSVDVRATAIGIDGGKGKDELAVASAGTLTATATARLDSVSIEINGADAATADASVRIDAAATGIAAGAGKDTVSSSGTVKAVANATLSEVGVNASFVDVTIADRQGKVAQASSTLTASAIGIGIDGAQAKDALGVTQGGVLQALATADGHSTQVALASEGVPGTTWALFEDGGLASVGLHANSQATAVLGGSARDRIAIDGSAVASAVSTATQESINVGIAIFDFKLPTPGIVLGSAGSGADAAAAGVVSGAGRDEIALAGSLDVDATATASATTVSVNIAELSVDFLKSVPLLKSIPGVPLGASMVVSDTTTEAHARAAGIASGAGRDEVLNAGVLTTDATAESGSTAAAATLNIKFKEGDNFLALNAVGARAVTWATAEATGLDGGAGRDTVRNDGSATVGADATAHALAVAIDVAGTVQGKGGAISAALTDTSSIASATATGLRGGDGSDREDDTLVNAGSLAASATADVASTSVSLSVGVARQGLVAGAALARSGSVASAAATGIDGVVQGDSVLNSGTLQASADAEADAVSVSASLEGTAKGLAAGAALADAGTQATATAVGIRAADTAADKVNGRFGQAPPPQACAGCHPPLRLDNAGAIGVDAEARTHAVGVAVEGGLAKTGVAVGAALTRSSAIASSSATGLQASSQGDVIDNAGSIGLRSVAAADAVSVSLTVEGTAKGLAAGAALADAHVEATAGATAIAAGAGDDLVVHTGSITATEVKSTATAVAVAPSLLVAKQGAALGAALANTSATATTTLLAIDGGDGQDELRSRGAITLQNLAAEADAVTVSLQLALAKEGVGLGAALADSDSNAHLVAGAIGGGAGDDRIDNGGPVTLQHLDAEADAVSVSIALSGASEGVAIGAALVDADAWATVEAAALAGGDGHDRMANSGALLIDDVMANADATGVGVAFTFAKQGLSIGAALAQTGARASTTVRAMDGGAGNDDLVNDGPITLSRLRAEADAVSVSVGLAAANDGVAVGAALADASGTAEVRAHAMDGGDGDDRLVNRGTIALSQIGADGDASSITVALAGANAGVAAGVTVADTSAIALAHAKGLDGGAGDDLLWNSGSISLATVGADADAVSVSVALSGAVSGVSVSAALGRAQARAEARATGLDGGAGHDRLGNEGSITIDGVDANTDAVGVSAQLGVTNAGVAIGAALVDTHATAIAEARGLAGGAGDDWLGNSGSLWLRNVKADAKAVSVGVSLNAAISGGVAAGVALTDGSGVANALAIGMAGGDGRDTLVNSGSLSIEAVEAAAHATGVSVTLSASMAGVAGGAAIADTSANATTDVVGLDGGAGDDTLANSGSVAVAGKASADAVSVGVQVSGSVGVAGGATLTDASTWATATTTGLAGGTGLDLIANDGAVSASAEAVAKSTAVSIGISVGVGGDATLADARSTATATATALHDSGGARIVNRGTLAASAVASATGTGIAGNLLGFALGETTNESTASAAGIRSGDGADLVRNEGAIVASGQATTQGLAVAVTLGGKALGNATSTATANVTGIDSGGMDDGVENLAPITVDARSSASATSVSVGLAGVAEANASTHAWATARGIAGGEGNDTLLNTATLTVSAGLPALRDGTGQCTPAAGGACARASTVGVTLAGYGEATAGSTATASATGIDGGGGSDAIDSAGATSVQALARSRSDGVGVTLAGAADVDANGGADAFATGLAGGAGSDRIDSRGAVSVHAAAESDAKGSSVTLAGSGSATGNTLTRASAAGIDGGDDDDAIVQQAAGTLAVTATTASTVSASSWTFAGAASSQATLGAVATARGIAGGAGADALLNEGGIDVDAAASLSASGGANAIFGKALAGTQVTADAAATGLDGGTGADLLRNSGSIAAHASAVMSSSATAFTFAGGASSNEVLNAVVTAIGIDGGAGDNALINQGPLTVASSAQLTGTGGSSSWFGNTVTGATVSSRGIAAGMRAGDGHDVLLNAGTGSIAVTVSAGAKADNDTSAGAFFVDGWTRSDAASTLLAHGLQAGGGDNALRNEGSVSVTLGGLTQAQGVSDAGLLTSIFGINSDAFAYSNATVHPSVAAGLVAGAGRDAIEQLGSLTVSAAPSADAYANANGQGLVDGDGTASAIAHLDDLQATGIDAGHGDNAVLNAGSIQVSATPLASSNAVSDGDGPGSVATSITTATVDRTRAVGIRVGDGANLVLNTGSLVVNSDARATAVGGASPGFLGTAHVYRTASAVDVLAAGILAGDGGNRIVNSGVIDVHAKSTGAQASSARAWGIRSGSGNDSIVNGGTISAWQTVNGTTVPGTAIDAGAGDDSVTLADGSLTQGHVELGAGNDVLVLQGSPVLQGDIVAGAGALTLQLQGSGSFAGALPAAAVVKSGAGTYTLPALQTAPRIELRQGTLRIEGGYRFEPQGTLLATVNGDGSHGRLQVGGTVLLAGRVKVERGDGPFLDGTRFDLLQAEGAIAAGSGFSAVELPAATRLLAFEAQARGDGLGVVAGVQSFTTVATSAGERAVARQLDRLLPVAQGGLRQTLGRMQTLDSDAQFASAFASLNPAAQQRTSAASLDATRRHAQALLDRMATQRVMALSSSSAPSLRLSLRGAAAMGERLAAAEDQAALAYGLWRQGFSQRGQDDGTGIARSQDVGGVAFGIDQRLGSAFTAGVSFARARNELSATTADDRARVDTSLVAVYGSYFDRRLYLGTTLSAGRNAYDQRRSIVVGHSVTPVGSSHRGDVLSGTLEAGYLLPVGAAWLDPFASLQATRLREDAVRETGSDSGLNIEARSVNTLVSQLGMRWSRTLQTGRGGTATPELSLGWLHDFSRTPSVSAAYAGAPDARFSVEGEPVRRDGLAFGLGFSYRSTRGLTSAFRLHSEWRGAASSRSVVGELRYEF